MIEMAPLKSSIKLLLLCCIYITDKISPFSLFREGPESHAAQLKRTFFFVQQQKIYINFCPDG